MKEKINRKALINEMLKRIEEKLSTIEDAIVLAKESRDSDGKSSVGDKYETGRAMMQIEIQNKEVQRGQTLALKKILMMIKSDKVSENIELGSYVKTTKGNYFISIPLGAIKGDGYDCVAISMASPLGRVFNGKSVGEKATFNGNEYVILAIE